MEKHEATFEIESKTDAYAVDRLMEQLYNSLREESRSLRAGSEDATSMLASFEAIRNAARSGRPGRLTVIYEQHEKEFDG
jgi:hypothetical protein